ncbi:DUF4292 domain-containing protein [Pedobacter cryophilus]|uniref:DUF4292 domain-containing protein n=1 Tax=Pedobacter cryophilus TaxID=2571271 RepID=A0A4U1C6C1_9SPHI|nr:DUF4292 domain-containing protein [Pedobacter cryophilus]TKC01003.1 DUF4292 domain-containing protein [Pedobacter cryophilus]
MKRNILNKLLLLTFCAVFFSCKAKKAIIKETGGSQPIENKKTELLSIRSKESVFSTFSTKAITNLNLNGKEYDATLNIRIKKGEGIWVSITAFAGFEIARTIITPDSVKIMDRINDDYIKKPFSFIHEFTNKQIDYLTLESLLVGNCVPFTLNGNSNIILDNALLNIKGNSQSLNYNLQFNEQFKATYTFLSDEFAQQTLTVNTPLFEEIANQLIPIKVSLDSKTAKKQIKVAMEYSKTQLNLPVDFPFNVPKRFSVID